MILTLFKNNRRLQLPSSSQRILAGGTIAVFTTSSHKRTTFKVTQQTAGKFGYQCETLWSHLMNLWCISFISHYQTTLANCSRYCRKV